MAGSEGTRHCPNCGTRAGSSDRFCTACGKPLEQQKNTPAGEGGFIPKSPPVRVVKAGTFANLDWGKSFKKSAAVVLVYVFVMYVLSRAAPDSFGLQTGEEWLVTLSYALFFLLLFAVVHAFTERSYRLKGVLPAVKTFLLTIVVVPVLLLPVFALVVAVVGTGEPAAIWSETPRDERNATVVYSLVSDYEWGSPVYDVQVSGSDAQLEVNAEDFRITEDDARYLCETTLDLSPGMIETEDGTFGHLEKVHVRGKSDMLSNDLTYLATCSW